MNHDIFKCLVHAGFSLDRQCSDTHRLPQREVVLHENEKLPMYPSITVPVKSYVLHVLAVKCLSDCSMMSALYSCLSQLILEALNFPGPQISAAFTIPCPMATHVSGLGMSYLM